MNKVRSRQALLVVCLLMVSLIFAGCGKDDTSTDNTDKVSQKVKIGLLRIDDSLPFFVAEKEGLFTKHGVDVELLSFGSARDKDVALEAGEIDGVMTDMVVAALLEQGGTDIGIASVALGATPEEGRFLVVAAPNSGIETLADLKGKKVAVGNNTIVHYLAEQLMIDAGFAASEIVTVNIPDLKLRLDATIEGKDVDACVLPDPLASLAVLEGGKLIVDDTKIEKNITQSVVVFSEKSLQGKKDEINKMMTAYFEAMELINADPAKYHAMMIEFSRVPEVLADDYTMSSYTAGVLPTEEQVNNVIDWMVTKGMLSEKLTYDNLIADDYR